MNRVLASGGVLVVAALGVYLGCSSCSAADEHAAPPDASAEASEVSTPDSPTDSKPKDSAEDVYGGDWNDGTFLTDPKLWTAVADNRDCGLFVGKVVPDPFPKRVWSSCGAGCEVSDAPLLVPEQKSVTWGSATASERNGEIYIRLRHGMANQGRVYLTSRLSDGATIAAVQIRGKNCGSLGWGRDFAALFPVTSGDDVRGGVIESFEPGTPVVWGKWLPRPGYDSLFMWNGGWGMSAGPTLFATRSPNDSAFAALAEPAHPYDHYGRDDQVIWAWGENGPAVRGFRDDSGVTTLWKTESDGYMHAVAIGEQHMAWIIVDGPEYPSKYRFVSSALYWSPRAKTASEVQVSGPLSLAPSETDLVELRVGDGIAAVKGCYTTGPDTGACPIYVVELATGKRWAIPPRPGSAYWGVLSASATTVLVAETNWPPGPWDSQVIRRILRFSVAELDALEQAW